jgi:hypothetical protein
MAMMHAYPAPREHEAVDLSRPVALAALIESSLITDAERHLYNGFALRRLEIARHELKRLGQAGTKPAAG